MMITYASLHHSCILTFFGLFVNIKSIQFPGVDLEHGLHLIRLTKLLSSKKVSNVMLKAPKITLFL